VNMGERVLFIVTGKVPDHSKPKRPKVTLGDDLTPMEVSLNDTPNDTPNDTLNDTPGEAEGT
jgi:hypothetical protein